MKAALFDLDDTLYDEMSFVRSGFREVSVEIALRYHLSPELILEQMLDIIGSQGRGRVFNAVLERHGIHDLSLVDSLVQKYRGHRPRIELFSDVVPVLQELRRRGLRLGLITDGDATAQRRKVEALELQNHMDVIVITDELGKEFWKPHPLPFLSATDSLNVKTPESVYVGDNPAKDFKGCNTLGMTTIHLIRTGQCCWDACDADHHAKDLFGVLEIINGLGAKTNASDN